MGASLYAIGSEFERILDLIDEAGGEITEHVSWVLDALELDEAAKVESYCKLIRTLEARAKMRRDEAKRLAESAASDERLTENLKNRLIAHLDRTHKTKTEAGVFTVRVQANSCPSVLATPPAEELPELYRVVKLDVNRKALAEAFKQGDTLPPGVIVETGRHLRIS